MTTDGARPRVGRRVKRLLIAAAIALVAAIYPIRRAAELAADPVAPKDCPPVEPDANAAPAAPMELATAANLPWSQRGGTDQRRELLEPDARSRRRPGAHRGRRARGAGVCEGQRPARVGCGREAQHGRSRVRAERRGPRHDRVQPDCARRAGRDGHGPERRDLARHPAAAASALCREGDAVDRHLHGRRFDFRQRARHGSSRRIGRRDDSRDAGHARGWHHQDRQPQRESPALQSRGRRLRTVWRHPRCRSGRHAQRRLSLGTRDDDLPRLRAGTHEAAAARAVVWAHVRPPVDQPRVAARRDASLCLSPGGRERRADSRRSAKSVRSSCAASSSTCPSTGRWRCA